MVVDYLRKRLMKVSILSKAFFLLIVFLLSSCHVYYDGITEAINSDKSAILKKSQNLEIQKPIRWNISGDIIGYEKDFKIEGIATIFNDNRAQFNLYSKTFGIELLKCDFVNDSIIYLDRLNKKYYKGWIDSLPFLSGLKINTEEAIKIITGKNFNNAIFKYNSRSGIFYNYRKSNINGEVSLYAEGFNKEHKILFNGKKLDIGFFDYLRKEKLPTIVKGYMQLSENKVIFNFKFQNIENYSGKAKEFVIPKGYTKIN